MIERGRANVIAAALVPGHPPFEVFPEGWALVLPEGETIVIERATGEARRFPSSVVRDRIFDSYATVRDGGVVLDIPAADEDTGG